MDLSPSTFVKIDGTRVSVAAHGTAEAKLALKELKLKKKELGVQKRVIASRQKEVRASYTDEVRTRGSMMRGGAALVESSERSKPSREIQRGPILQANSHHWSAPGRTLRP